MDNKRKEQAKILLIATGGLIGFYFLHAYFTTTYFSLDELGQAYLGGLFAASIGIVIFVLKRKFGMKQLEYYELLMLIIIAVIAVYNLLPIESLDPTWIIVFSIIALVIWFVYFGLGKYLGDEKKITKIEFQIMLFFFIGLTIIIIGAFNVIRVFDLFKSAFS